MRILSALAMAAAVALAPSTSSAEWYRVSSPHFIIYSEQAPETLRPYAERLERFDQAVRYMLRWDDPALGDGNRLTVYMVKDVDAIERLYGKGGAGVAGFFIPRYSGPIAFMPQAGDTSEWGLNADGIFFHEYGHHLTFQHFDRAMPSWFIEGFAELVGGQQVDKDGTLKIGLSPKHRAAGLFSSQGLTTREVLTKQPSKLAAIERDSLYGRGWLLTHYLLFNPGHTAQLDTYMNALSAGKSMEVAATEAFGDLRKFDGELERYLRRRTLLAATFPPSMFKTGKIDITPLSPGAAQAVPLQMMSKRGVYPERAAKVAEGLRQIAQRYPDDPFVLGALAEAEADVRRVPEALAAADRALKIDPRNMQALIYRARSMMTLAGKLDVSARLPQLKQARETLLAANKIDPEDPEPLYLYYQTYLEAGQKPTANAIAALHYSAALAPGDPKVRIASAGAHLADGQIAEARKTLLPVAYNPHGQESAALARAVIELIDQGKGVDALKNIGELRQKLADEDEDAPKPKEPGADAGKDKAKAGG